ncbi:MAG: hypothetical protein IM506_20310 [Microcystis sp. M19BS1]|uniref:hypothetical protein n=1 Tax=Microcystis sp. M19BS1 TaxID=2771180 RepID=UPI00258746B1|nr:hypothetical protein [Microcystis sp. M19BS1]MCA2626027.1 hypothetical protein [Microcystis sp. M19BS1]
MAAILIGSLIDDIEDADIEDAYNEMYEPPDDPDPLYIYMTFRQGGQLIDLVISYQFKNNNKSRREL